MHSVELERRITGKIHLNGSIPFDQYMEHVLYDKDHGYYTNSIQLARKGSQIKHDFITAPDSLSPRYGFALGQMFSDVACNLPLQGIRIREMGAGNGTLARDILSCLKIHHPQIYDAVTYEIIEVSPRLIGHQQQRLHEHQGKVEFRNESVHNAQLDSMHGMIISNELPDAFPVNMGFKYRGKIMKVDVEMNKGHYSLRWDQPFRHRLTPLDEELTEFVSRYGYDSHMRNARFLSSFANITRKGVPLSTRMETWYQGMVDTLDAGAIVTIDYGHKTTQEHCKRKEQPTLRTFSRHKNPFLVGMPNNPFTLIGHQDITTDVNFEVLRTIGEKQLTTLYDDNHGPGLSYFIGKGVHEWRIYQWKMHMLVQGKGLKSTK